MPGHSRTQPESAASRSWRSEPPAPVNRGSDDTAKLIFASEPRIRMCRTAWTNSGWKVRRIDEIEQRASRIGVRDDLAGRHDLARAEDHARRRLSLHDNLPDRRADPDLGAGLSGRAGERVADAADAAASGPPRRNRVPLAGPQPQEHGGAAARSRAQEGAECPAGRDGCRERFALEPFAGEIGGRHRQPSQQSVRVGLAERAKPPRGLEEIDQAGGGQMVDRRRQRLDQRPQHARDRGHAGQKSGIPLGVRGRERRDRARGPCGVGPDRQRPPVLRRRPHARGRPHDLEAVARQVQRAEDGGIDRRPVRERRAPEPRGDLGGDRAAPNLLGPLEDERFQAGFREERGSDEPVVTAADDDYVVHGKER